MPKDTTSSEEKDVKQPVVEETQKPSEDTPSKSEDVKSESIPYERFKEVNAAKAKAEAELAEIKKQQEEAERKKLEEEGRYKELLEKVELEKEELVNKNRQVKKQAKISNLASRQGIDPEMALKLLDDSDVTYDEETGEVKGVQEAMDKMVEKWPQLVQKGSKPVGTPTNPSSNSKSKPEPAEGQSYTHEEIAEIKKDPEQWAKHKSHIMDAFANGRIS